MKTLIENYENGNLTTAKAQARRYSLQKLVDGLTEYGHGLHSAYDIANYLKGCGSFKAACDSSFAERAR